MAKSKKSKKSSKPAKSESGFSLAGIAAMVNSSTGRDLLAEALVAAAGAAAATLRGAEPVTKAAVRGRRRVVEATEDTASKAKDIIQSAVGVVSGVIGDAAANLLPEPSDKPRRGRKAAAPLAATASPAPRRRGRTPRAAMAATSTPAKPGRKPRTPRAAASTATSEPKVKAPRTPRAAAASASETKVKAPRKPRTPRAKKVDATPAPAAAATPASES